MFKAFYEWRSVYFYDKIIAGSWVRNMAGRLTIFVNLFDLPPSQSYGNFNVHFLYSSRRLKTIPLTTQASFMALYVLFIPPE